MTILLVASSAMSTAPALAQASPMEVYQKYLDARDRGDVEAVVSLFAEDGVFVGGGGCRPTPCVGSAAIRTSFRNQVVGHYRATLLDSRVEGDTVFWRATIENDMTLAAGIPRIRTAGTTVVRGGKIAELRALPDPSDPDTARFLEWQARQAPAMPAALPRAGDAEPGPFSVALATLLAGILLIGAGARCLRRPGC
jgi:ketosteroid isomerase-like protein